MTRRQITHLVCTAAVVASGLGAAAPTDHRTAQQLLRVHRVQPGESIQRAVNAALPGDTVVLSPGTYHESVSITVPDLTLRGSLAGHAVIVPGPASADGTCAKAGNGICVTGTKSSPVKGVTLRSLTIRNFTKNGLWASWTDKLKVQNVTAEKNGQWGLAQERSVRGVFSRNLAQHNGDAGLFVANTVDREDGAQDSKGTVVSHNRLVGNRIGLTVRRLRNLTVERNEATGNCAGVFVVGDEGTPRAGAMTVRRNHVHTNNKLCPKTPRLPFLQGSGIVLTGTEKTLVTKNRVEDNVGASPLSGGIVLFKSFVGAPSESNEIVDNVVRRNSTADLANRDTGKNNTFRGNKCGVSEPAGMC
ncbi:right-handed parallel beta-helix repeat-containing protein [Streptomyces sp. ME02-8801-2C]|uniref:right-handed parallel beta-helix repeat-containing protein n=1 Tax=Streptomyces sp. ME02-8801-2C TaxID=3028680 RepID=UPI0029B4AC01|nr:right-handed parallel beta-helix repeat-containing protein [Streptomyces sp. ME02-8801-2C]MDX3452871.1 right-handed parallel beta-helix repeat-containing protein [Streptomyces sp. ME02-8801-2C]